MSVSTPSTPKVPSSVVLPEDLPETAVCPGCGVSDPATDEYWFPHRASGGLHLNSKHGHRVCEAAYRAEQKQQLANGERTVTPRGAKQRAAAEAAAAAVEQSYLGSPAYGTF